MPMKAGICIEKGENPMRRGPASPDSDALPDGAAAPPPLQAASVWQKPRFLSDARWAGQEPGSSAS